MTRRQEVASEATRAVLFFGPFNEGNLKQF